VRVGISGVGIFIIGIWVFWFGIFRAGISGGKIGVLGARVRIYKVRVGIFMINVGISGDRFRVRDKVRIFGVRVGVSGARVGVFGARVEVSGVRFGVRDIVRVGVNVGISGAEVGIFGVNVGVSGARVGISVSLGSTGFCYGLRAFLNPMISSTTAQAQVVVKTALPFPECKFTIYSKFVWDGGWWFPGHGGNLGKIGGSRIGFRGMVQNEWESVEEMERVIQKRV
jgi:hypothetical protein